MYYQMYQIIINNINASNLFNCIVCQNNKYRGELIFVIGNKFIINMDINLY